MSLAVGSKLGPYEVVGAAGAGGMGEVYRARDTRLERTVALKVLPTQLLSLTGPASPLTQKGTIVGTFQYMAPEVLQGAEADARSDIFSLGCVLYEMATGRRAFEGKSQLSVLAAILEKEPEPMSQVQ